MDLTFAFRLAKGGIVANIKSTPPEAAISGPDCVANQLKAVGLGRKDTFHPIYGFFAWQSDRNYRQCGHKSRAFWRK
jgi:hypothetical protein